MDDATGLAEALLGLDGFRVLDVSETRRAFAAYWFLIRPASGAIRREVLRTVAHRAESRVG